MNRDKALHSIFGEYVKALREGGHLESQMPERILKSSTSVLESFNDVLRISANVTGDFGNVTGLRSGAGLRGEDCRKGLVLTGLATS